MGKAMGKFVEAKAAFEDDGACETSAYAELLVQIGICYSMQCKKKEEMEKYKEAQKVYQKAASTGTREYAGLLKNMGIWFMEHDQMSEAMEKFQEAESRYIFAKATGTCNYAGLLTSMGKWLLNSGSEVQAMAKFKEAKRIYEANKWLNHGKANLSGDSKLRNFKPNICYFQRCNKRWKRFLAAVVLWSYFSQEHAVVLCGLILKGSQFVCFFLRKRKACTDAAIAYAGLLMIIGNVHRSQLRFKEALELFDEAQKAFEAAGATATTDYLQLLSQLAVFHYEQGNPSVALKKYTHAQAAFEVGASCSKCFEPWHSPSCGYT